MSVLSNNLESKSYTLFISSNDKISGSNNNGSYQINWQDFLPTNFNDYKLSFSFQSGGGNYKDSNATFTATTTLGSNVLSVTAITNGTTNPIAVGTLISGGVANGIPANTYITAYSTGTGTNTGNYIMSNNATLASSNIPLTGTVVYSGCKIVMNTLGRSYSFDTSNKGESITLGYAQRDIQSTTSVSNSFSSFYLQFPPKTMIRPNQNFITISLYNLNNNFLLTDTTSAGVSLTDCTTWNLILEFVPIASSKIN